MSVGKGSIKRVTGATAPVAEVEAPAVKAEPAKKPAAKAPAKKTPAKAPAKTSAKKPAAKKPAEKPLHTPAAPIVAPKKGTIKIGDPMPVWLL